MYIYKITMEAVLLISDAELEFISIFSPVASF